MPPRVKVTKEDIIRAAVDIARKSGAQAINARTVAGALECSTQPVFSNFTNMDELRMAVVEQADRLCNRYIRQEVESGKYPTYKASGMAYIRFAKEEKELFKLLYMRDRRGEKDPEHHELTEQMNGVVQKNTGLTGDASKLFHMEMWAYVHGIAAMVATDFLKLDREFISRMLTDAYRGLRKQYGLED